MFSLLQNSPATTTLFTVIMLLATACGGIEGNHPENGTDGGGAHCWGEPGEKGGNGGNGGDISIRFAALEQIPIHELVAALHTSGGEGGATGAHGKPVPPTSEQGCDQGNEGKEGNAEVHHQPDLLVDLQGIESDDALYVTSNEIYLKTKMLQGPLRVRRFIIAPGVTLQLSGGWVIEAEEVIISPGASIVISDLGDRSQNVLGRAVGENGGSLVIRAQRLALHGDIIASGLPGSTAKDGGSGGEILIEAQTLLFGSEAGIHASGGSGGEGNAGTSCP